MTASDWSETFDTGGLDGGNDKHRSSSTGSLERRLHCRFLSYDQGRPSQRARTTARANCGPPKAPLIRHSRPTNGRAKAAVGSMLEPSKKESLPGHLAQDPSYEHSANSGARPT
jgi:hypothetical protein